jgi:hypothetical protein
LLADGDAVLFKSLKIDFLRHAVTKVLSHLLKNCNFPLRNLSFRLDKAAKTEPEEPKEPTQFDKTLGVMAAGKPAKDK